MRILERLGVRMSSGFRSRSSRAARPRPARRHSSALPGSSAGSDELYGSVRPSASIATAIVFAVYMPAARAGARTRVAHDLEPLLVGDHAGDVLAVRLERRDDVARLAERMPGANRAAVHHQRQAD